MLKCDDIAPSSTACCSSSSPHVASSSCPQNQLHQHQQQEHLIHQHHHHRHSQLPSSSLALQDLPLDVQQHLKPEQIPLNDLSLYESRQRMQQLAAEAQRRSPKDRKQNRLEHI
jgi:hypothetical protein